MATQRKGSKDLCRVDGKYRRTIGKHLNMYGKIAPKKFMLGRDRKKAEVANAKLELLWPLVVQKHGNAERRFLNAPSTVRGEPIWKGLELEIAEAIRQHQHVFTVAAPDEPLHTPAGYASHLHFLNTEYGHLLRFMPSEAEGFRRGQELHADAAAHRARQAGHNAAVASVAIPPTGQGGTLYGAVDEFGAYLEKRPTKAETKRKAIAEAQQIKNAIADMPLDAFGFDAIQQVGDHWRSRPMSNRRGKGARPVAIDTVKNFCKTTKRFVKWLNRSSVFNWQSPPGFEDALNVSERSLRTEEERAGLSKGTAAWTVHELVTLYEFATDRDRVLMLLALNFGFAQAEIITLRSDEFVTKGTGTILKRLRHKTEVYGEWAVWPETLEAINWLANECRRGGHDPEGYVYVTENGTRPQGQSLGNMWQKLLLRCDKNNASLTQELSFKYLRKTAGQLVREVADGETAGVFLAHGKPVDSDALLDVYTRRIFERVYAANKKVHTKLKPMFASALTAFEKPRSQGSANISRVLVKQIQDLWNAKVSPSEIARATGVSRTTVYRHRPTVH